MMRIGKGIRASARALGILGLLAAGPASAQIFKSVNFEKQKGPAKFTADGTEVTLTPIADDGLVKASAAIKVPGFAPVVVTEDVSANAAYDRWVGIGKLAAADAAPSILLQGFTGGAHCCATMTVVTPYQGALKTLTFEPIDGGGTDAFPTDIDKNGVVDFYRQDDRYRWEAYAKEMRDYCADQASDERNSACAAYVVAGKHLGRFDAALRDANTLANNSPTAIMPEACKVELVDYACPAGQELKFANFEEALRWVMEFGKPSD
jgi:hypothetical protein